MDSGVWHMVFRGWACAELVWAQVPSDIHIASFTHVAVLSLFTIGLGRGRTGWESPTFMACLSSRLRQIDTWKELLISWITSFLVRIFYCSVKFIVLLKTPFPGNRHSLSKRKGSSVCPGLASTWKGRDGQSLTVSRQPSVGWALYGSNAAQPSKQTQKKWWGLSPVMEQSCPFSADGSQAASSTAKGWTTKLTFSVPGSELYENSILGWVTQSTTFQLCALGWIMIKIEVLLFPPGSLIQD